MNRIAIIDLGTNTFNLLVAEGSAAHIKILHEEKVAVKLGRGGMNNQSIMPEAMERGIKTLSAYKQTIGQFGEIPIYAIGTSALRSASNAGSFVKVVSEKLNISIQIIDGQTEADFIFWGVNHTVDFGGENYMILDIGGGSNEFIITDGLSVLWKHSYNLGMARIIEKFHLSDPIGTSEERELVNYFRVSLPGLDGAVHLYKPQILVGASGTFDTFRSILEEGGGLTKETVRQLSVNISLDQFQFLSQLLISSTLAERTKIKGLPSMRVEFMVPATIFVKTILEMFAFQRLYQSDYSLKEGALFKFLQN